MVKYCLILLFCIQISFLEAQEEAFFEKGLLRGTTTISPGFHRQTALTNIYLHGFLEYYLHKKVSVKGHTYYNTGSQGPENLYQQDYEIYYGAAYHFRKNKFDTYIAFEPGITLASINLSNYKLNTSYKNVSYTTTTLYPSPVISIDVGAIFYASKFYDFFLSARYIHGNYFSDSPKAISLDEIRISAGLGFHWNRIHLFDK